MPTWTFWDYVDNNGLSQIQAWLDASPMAKRERLRSKLLAILQGANAVGRLKYPRFEVPEGRYRNLIVIRFERNKVAYRIFACYGNVQPPAIWLLACGTESNDNYRPTGIWDTAMQRRADILQDRTRVRPTCLTTRNS